MPTSKDEIGTYFYETNTNTSGCPPTNDYFSSNGHYTKRSSVGATGKSTSRVPKFNAYDAFFQTREPGLISVDATVRSWTDHPCDTATLSPMSHHFDKVDTYADFLTVPSVSSQGARNCFGGFVNKIGKAQQSLQALVTVGEARETFKMIKSPLKSFVRLTVDYVNYASTPPRLQARRQRRRQSVAGRQGAKRLASSLNDAYLEYTFGLEPLLSDIRGTLNAYYRNRDTYSQVKRVSSRVTETKSSYSSASSWGSQYVEGYRNISNSYTARLQYICYLTASMPLAPGESPFLRDIGLTLTDFVPSVYELIPWSFVLDYFVDIGGYLNRSAVMARNGASVNVCKTYFAQALQETNPVTYTYPGDVPQTPYPKAGVYGVSSSHSTGSAERTSVSRSISNLVSAGQLPKPSPGLPGWKQDLNLASLGAAFALSEQRHPLTSKQRALFGVR